MVRWEAANSSYEGAPAHGSQRPRSPRPSPPFTDFSGLLGASQIGSTSAPFVSSAQERARPARDLPTSRADPASGLAPDAAALAAAQLTTRGPLRAPVQAASQRALRTQGSTSMPAVPQAPSLPDDSLTPSNSTDAALKQNPRSDAAPPRVLASTPLPLSCVSDATTPQTPGGPRDPGALLSPPRGQSANKASDTTSASPPDTAPAPRNAALPATALPPPSTSTSASTLPASPSPSTTNSPSAIAVGAPKVTESLPSLRFQASAPPRPSTPSEESPSSAPGVRGQAMRGVFAMLRASQPGVSSAWLKLDPHGLGEMKINLSVHEGRVSAVFAVSTDQAQSSMRQALPELRQALEARGLLVDSIEVIHKPITDSHAEGSDFNAPGQDSSQLAGDSRNEQGAGGPDDGRHGHGARDRDDAGAEGSALSIPPSIVPGAEAPEGSRHTMMSLSGWKLGLDLTA